ncbi:Gfo/Idh/MocA family oxidoreductase [Arthrobacter rhombi]|uniref:Gfo/Idh/MocA family protein n=1 Tax=Arthrobacter rhombi TaxID=71253 RepID=UPI0031D676B4
MSHPSAAPLKVGIIGGGFMAKTHTRAALAAGADVVSVVSSRPERSVQAARELGIDHAAATVEELLERVDVVHVCSPNATHAGHARAVLEAGKHVVCEKPLAITPEGASELAELAARFGVTATVPFIYRFHPMARQARHEAAGGGIGRLLTVRGNYLQDWMLQEDDTDWRVDPATAGPSRAFADIGSHLVDLLEFIAGERIVRVNARLGISHPIRGGQQVLTEDAAVCMVEMEGGAVGSLMVSQVNAGRKNALTLELAGAGGSVVFDQEHPDELWLGGRAGSTTLARDAPSLVDDAVRLSVVPAGHPMGYLDAFNAFVADTYATIAGGAPAGLPTFADGLRAAIVTAAVLESSRSNAWVDVSAASDHRAVQHVQ